MRSVFRLLWISSVLVVVMLVSALMAMRFAVHGREVTVPDFKGTTPAEARAAAERLGLQTDVERQYYSPSVAEGRVLSQTPEPGTIVRRGWDVRLALSLGPQRVTIPNVVGESERAATINVAQRGLQLGPTGYLPLSGAEGGTVVAQDPPANATGVSGPGINLLVAQAPVPQAFVMPSFIGQPLGTVSNTLKDAGFMLGQVTMAAQPDAAQQTVLGPGSSIVPTASPSPASIIVAQEPEAGAKVTLGSALNFVVK